ncbi:hypothetical protein ACFY4B_25420 [Kitasatospora sp. NPDC001261]|uniref:hypothetical protein n=1 Tax=Kitasatospora sp. NPDC001261 TaxID=3364012 RepID=UPI0036861DF6
MSFRGYWVVMPVPVDVVADVAPVFTPLIDAQAAAGRERLERWRHESPGRPDVTELHDLAAPYLLDDHLDVLFGIWGTHEAAGPFLESSCRKGYPAVGLAHALRAERFLALPGWFGHFVLTPQEVRATLPAVQAALDLTPDQRSTVEQRLYDILDEVSEEDAAALLDDLVPVWRRAAATGQGLIGAQAIPC